MALQFVLIPPKLQHQQCNILPSFPKFSLSRCSSRGHRSLTNSVGKLFILKACLRETKRSREENDPDYRPLANFAPCIWKDTFASISFHQSEFESYDKQVEELKETVKDMLIASTKDSTENIILIDSLCRLGVSYHFEPKIEQQLNLIFESHANLADDHDYDPHATALLFRVLRQHGFKMPCGVFNKFKDESGMFKESLISDVKGMLSLYEAAHLRMHGEDILDEALAFTTTHLPSFTTNSSPHLTKHIIDALEQSFHTGIPRLETLKYISFYEEDESRNETLLKFAKLDFNRLQLVYQQELKLVISWWTDLNFTSIYSYSRERILEYYFLSVAQCFEPCHSRARLIFVKLITMLSVIDDTYDSYGTLNELQHFTDTIERWDSKVMTELPLYMRSLYGTILNLYDELDNDLAKEGRSHGVSCTKDMLKEVVRAYFVEAQCFREGIVPPFEELLSNALITGGEFFVPSASFVGMGEVAWIQAFDWLRGKPKILISSSIIARLRADIVSHEAEQKRGHVASVVESYMKEYGISREETVEKLEQMIGNAWKDVNEGCMRPTIVPMQILTVVLNITRIGEALYKKADGVTNPEHVKDYITKLFIDPMPM